MVVKNYDNIKYDSFKEKARGIIIDENNKILMVKIGDNLALPGGSLEEGENVLETIKRELIEEIGLVVDNIDFLETFIHFHENFYYVKTGGRGSRVNVIHYFFKKIKSSELKDNNPTIFELNHDLRIKSLSFDEILNELSQEGDELKNALAEETITILRFARGKKLI